MEPRGRERSSRQTTLGALFAAIGVIGGLILGRPMTVWLTSFFRRVATGYTFEGPFVVYEVLDVVIIAALLIPAARRSIASWPLALQTFSLGFFLVALGLGTACSFMARPPG